MRRVGSLGERYSPNSGVPPASAEPVPRSHEGEATVRLRRCREPLPMTGALWLKSSRRLRVEPLELELAQPLPDVCAPHGRAATKREPTRTCFYDTDIHPRYHRMAFERDLARVPLLRPRPTAPVSTIVVGEWPVCDRCHRTSRRYRFLALALVLLMVADVVALVIAAVADLDALVPPLAFGLFPGSFPFGVVVLVLLLGRGSRRVRFRPIDDERFAVVAAHPEFRAALGRIDLEKP